MSSFAVKPLQEVDPCLLDKSKPGHKKSSHELQNAEAKELPKTWSDIAQVIGLLFWPCVSEADSVAPPCFHTFIHAALVCNVSQMTCIFYGYQHTGISHRVPHHAIDHPCLRNGQFDDL
jgi:hypothetical protein